MGDIPLLRTLSCNTVMEIESAHSSRPMAKVAAEEMESEIERLLPGRHSDVGGIEQEMPRRFALSHDFAEVGGKSHFRVEARDGEMENWSRLVHCLYWSHFLSRWGDRMWEFAVGLFMIQVWPNSLLLVAIYGLVETASVATLGVLVGNLVDKCPRLRMVQFSLGIQNGSVVAAGLAVVMLLLHPWATPGGFSVFVMLVVIVNVFGAISALAGMAMDVVVERDWVVLIAEKQAPGSLTKINSVMRRIDLSCKLLAPIVVGFMMSSVSVLASPVLIAVWNIISVGIEYWLLHHVYVSMPALQQKSTAHQAYQASSQFAESNAEEVELSVFERDNMSQMEGHEEVSLLKNTGQQTTSRQSTFLNKLKKLPVIEGWVTYMHQEAVLAGLALAVLYFTVLSFGSLMSAFLSWRGIPPYVLGLARGVAAMMGILATFIFPIVHARLQTVRTGNWSIWIQWSLLSVCVVSVWIHNSKVASLLLISGVAASRLGLWLFDLSVTQLMQESVPVAERGVVGGVQRSLQSLMNMLTYAVGMVIVRPQDFGITICMSYGAVLTSALLYSMHVYRVRGHLFHFDRLLRPRWIHNT